MHSFFARAYRFFEFTLNVIVLLFFGCYLTVATKVRIVPVDIRVTKVMLRNVDSLTGPAEPSDLVFIKFNLAADLQPLFDWNVQQLFLFLSAEYVTEKNALNQVVLWDKIVRAREKDKQLNLTEERSKYFFFDYGNGLRNNTNVTLTLSWNITPITGHMPIVPGNGSISIPFPDKYEIIKSY